MALTQRQKKFADFYIKYGNETKAAKEAGYSEKTAYSIGSENLRKPEIKAYISERLAQIEEESIADIKEVLKFYTKVMRGEEKDQFGLDASLNDRLKAGDSLMKRYAAGAEKNKGTMEKLDNLLKEFKDAVKPETD